MKQISKTILVGVFLPALLLMSLLSAGMSPAGTAKAALSRAQDHAKTWQADAALVTVLSPDVDANGVCGAHYAGSWVAG
jgi:hypothetical protein